MVDYNLDDELEEQEPVEAFCVSCREKIEMEDPLPVWTSKGQPGTRGSCPICGTTVYRMGKTPAHDTMQPPEAITVVDNKGINRKSRAAKIKVEAATYVVGAATEADFIEKLATDLNAVGISTWVDNGEESDDVNWAGGVHPALAQCKKMVVVVSEFSVKTHEVEKAWTYFLDQRKPIFLVLAEDVDPPDSLRRRPRFEMYNDYKRAFRQLVQELSQ